jgi:hypothetical protein
MKKYVGLLTILAVCTAQASPVEPGDTREQVLEHLGEPQGLVKMDGAEWMLYPRGKVWLQEGVVTKAELLSPAAFAEKQVREGRTRIAEQIRLEAQRVERIEKGTELRARLLESPGMYVKSPQERLSVWKRFRLDYPEVDVSEHYLAALSAARVEQDRDEQDRRIRDLEARVREADLRALDDQQAAAERSSFRRTRYIYTPPVVYGPRASVCSRYGRTSHGHGQGYSSGHKSLNPGHPSSGVSASGTLALHRGHITMKPVTFGHVKFSF